MLKIIQSNRLELLALLMGNFFTENPLSPLKAEVVVVPHYAVARWLSLNIAKVSGISANMHFPQPAGFVWEVLSHWLDLPKTSRFTPDCLHWRIMQQLKDSHADDFAAVHQFIASGSGSKLDQISERLAKLMDSYLVYRGDWITSWESQETAVEQDKWQADLWRLLAQDDQDIHWVSVQKMLKDLDLTDKTSPYKRVSFFAMPQLSDGYMQVLEKLSEVMDIRLYLLNPCQEHWVEQVSHQTRANLQQLDPDEDLYLDVGHPLLSSFSQQGRSFFIQCLEVSAETDEYYLAADDDSLLHRLQNDILWLRSDKTTVDVDNSIQVHSCHSALREVEILRHQLLALIDADASLKPHDIMVLIPDIATYVPYIEMVFHPSNNAYRLPFSIADAPTTQVIPFIQAFFQLLRLHKQHYRVNHVLDLIELDAIADKFDFTDPERLKHWVSEVAITWSKDKQSREALDLHDSGLNSWRFGLDNLLMGYAQPTDSQVGGQCFYAYNEIEGDLSRMLGGLCQFIEQLFALDETLTLDQSIDEWSSVMYQVIGDFLSEPTDDMDAIEYLHGAINQLQEITHLAKFTEKVNFDVYLKHLEHYLDQQIPSQRYMSAGISFASFGGQVCLPFKVVCMLGVNDKTFPRQEPLLSFDLIRQHPRKGDRQSRLEDKYRFLEAILSARQVLYLSYHGQSQQDNSQLPPSSILSELLDYLSEYYSLDDALCLLHPLHEFSEKNFTDQDQPFSYSQSTYEALQAKSSGIQEHPPFCSDDLSLEAAEFYSLSLDELVSFYRSPSAYFLRHRLLIQPMKVDMPLDDRDPIELNPLVVASISDELLNGLREDIPLAHLICRLSHQGQLPHGQWGEKLLDELVDSIKQFHQSLLLWLPDQENQTCSIHFKGDKGEIQTELTQLYPKGQFFYVPRQHWGIELFVIWMQHLLLNQARPEGIGLTTYYLTRDTRYELSPLSKEAAEGHLNTLLSVYQQGQQQPIPFFYKLGYQVLTKLKTSPDLSMEVVLARMIHGQHSYTPEWEKPEVRLAFRGQDLWDEPCFQLITDLIQPLMACMTESSV